jgi:RHS repeat-associated protein
MQLARRFLILFVSLAFLVSAVVTSVGQASEAPLTGGPFTYVHDELGRLSAVVDPATETARYTYDPVGNILSITRQSSAIVSILEFAPNAGSVGAKVTIYGTAFSPTPASNAVTFNGTAAAVDSATATKLVATVPAGATSGLIAVTSPNGTATSADPFTVGSTAPVLSSFAPAVATPGTALTIKGFNFRSTKLENNVTLNVTRATVNTAAAGKLTTTVPAATGSGRVTVATPAGMAVSANDLFVPPSGYTAPQVAVKKRIALGGTTSASIGTAGNIAMVLFDASRGQHVGATMTNMTLSANASIYDPRNRLVAGPLPIGSFSPSIMLDTVLRSTGTFAIVIDPAGDTGSLTIAVAAITDLAGVITPGGPSKTAVLTARGQQARYSFTGNAGQRVSLSLDDSTLDQADVRIEDQDGSAIAAQFIGNGHAFVDTQELPTAGEYTIVVDPADVYSAPPPGQVTLTLYDVPVDAAFTVTPGGAAAVVTVTTPGQNARVDFAGTAGQVVSATFGDAGFGGLYALNGPGDPYAAGSFGAGAGVTGFMDRVTLPGSGTYSLLVDPAGSGTGSVTVTVFDVPPDPTGPITAGGASVTVTTTVPGQNAHLTFTASAGWRVSLIANNASMSAAVSLAGLAGTAVAPGQDGFIDATTIPTSGTYAIDIDPDGTGTGSVTITLYRVPADVQKTLVVDGPAVTFTTTVPGQNAKALFGGTSGGSLTLTATNVTIPYTGAEVFDPDGNSISGFIISSGGGTNSFGPLPSTGTYTIGLDPSGSATGKMTLKLATGTGLSTLAEPLPSRAPRQPGGDDAGCPQEGTAVGPSAQTSLPIGWNPKDPERWTPSEANYHGDWSSHRLPSPWSWVPPLQAESGHTALAGQVLRLNGLPLAAVALSIDGVTACTDRSGRFLLEGLTAGHHEMAVDGSAAGTATKRYGEFEVGVDLRPRQTNRLPNTVWMPLLDTTHAINISEHPTRALTITSPLIPGLEVRLPAGTRLESEDGEPVREVTLTPIPTDRAPFPIPQMGAEFGVYFTLQPGGTHVLPRGAQIVYPNYSRVPSGTRLNFWEYEPAEGWHAYGMGTVSANGRQIVPDKDVVVDEFYQAAMDQGYGAPGTWPPVGNPGGHGGEPVDLSTGLYVMNQTDMYLPDVMPLSIDRTYRPNDEVSRRFGIGSSFSFEYFLYTTNEPVETNLILPDGGRVRFQIVNPGSYPPVWEANETPGPFYKARVTQAFDRPDHWYVKLRDGTWYVIRAHGGMDAIIDRNGNEITITRSGPGYAPISQVTSPNGRWIQFQYDGQDRITQAQDLIGRTVHYQYNVDGLLDQVTDVAGGVTHYTYGPGPTYGMLTITDPRGFVGLTNEYDSQGRVIKQTQADGTTFLFAYTLSGGKIVSTNLTDPLGTVRQIAFNADGYVTGDTYALGRPEKEKFTYQRAAGSNLINSITDPLGRKTSYTHDAEGRVVSMTRLAGTAGAVTTNYAYDPSFDQLTKITDPLGHATTITRDTAGNATAIKDATNRTTAISYTDQGRPASVTDPLGNITTIQYLGGDLNSVTDPLGDRQSAFVDAGGRALSVTDALGASVAMSYDAHAQPLKLVDALGGTTLYTYDLDSNLLTTVDPRNSKTTYTYDNRNRMASRTDALLRKERFAYDGLSNLVKFTDRKGQVTTFKYDRENRLTFGGFGTSGTPATYQSTIGYTYDAGNRLIQLVDSAGGTISRQFDLLGRLTSETTSLGSLSYVYDKAGRRTSMSATGQPAVTYSYDNANRLLSLLEGTAGVALAYDLDGRRKTVTLPNGVVTTYAYDTASRLASLTYKKGATTLGDLAYSYDAAGRIEAAGGTSARTTLPDPVASAAFDAANEQTAWNGSSFSYDPDGNLVNDGTNAYTWDARNQLAGISGTSVTASFTYDAFGRRSQRTVGGASVQYLYDGPNVVQELSGGTPVANLLTGLGLDEVFSRTDGGETASFLRDRLGSTVGLTDATGAATTAYTYDPFGAATATGPASTNTFQFTGRENDGTGLDFYRARYYSPGRGRFLSEDPWAFDDHLGGSRIDPRYLTRSAPPGRLWAEYRPLPIWSPSGATAGSMPGQGSAYIYAGDDPAGNVDATGMLFGGYGGWIGLGVLGVALLVPFVGITAAVVFGGLILGGFMAVCLVALAMGPGCTPDPQDTMNGTRHPPPTSGSPVGGSPVGGAGGPGGTPSGGSPGGGDAGSHDYVYAN